MIKADGKYIRATMHDCKNNLSKLLGILHDPDTPYEAVLIERYGKTRGVLLPYAGDCSAAGRKNASGLGPFGL
jgi:hypothetical protein